MLDRIFDGDRATLVTVPMASVERAPVVELNGLHDDSTPVTFTGIEYPGGEERGGKPALRSANAQPGPPARTAAPAAPRHRVGRRRGARRPPSPRRQRLRRHDSHPYPRRARRSHRRSEGSSTWGARQAPLEGGTGHPGSPQRHLIANQKTLPSRTSGSRKRSSSRRRATWRQAGDPPMGILSGAARLAANVPRTGPNPVRPSPR